jgi:hypothetical protein
MRLSQSRTDYPPGRRTRSKLLLIKQLAYIPEVSGSESATSFLGQKITKNLSILLILI